MQTQFWISEFEETQTDPNVTFEVEIGYEPDQKGGLEQEPIQGGNYVEDVRWDFIKYSNSENAIIEGYYKQVEIQALKEFKNQ